MRQKGTCFEVLRTRPGDHIGWVFEGPAQFVELARDFLAEGAARNERLMVVADEPPNAAFSDFAGGGRPESLQLASISEVYGPDMLVDAHAQRATFNDVLDEALDAGFSGIRVVADNTPLVATPERLAAWVGWEVMADRFMANNPVTGLCAFDGKQVEVDILRHLATLHPLSSPRAPAPQYRMFAEGSCLRVEGEIDELAVAQIRLGLAVLAAKTRVRVDLSDTPSVSKATLLELLRLSEEDVVVTLAGLSSRAGELAARLELPTELCRIEDPGA